MKNAIVTGGTGLIGTALVNDLLANDYRVAVILRGPEEFGHFDSPQVTEIVCDLDEITSLPERHPELTELNPRPLFFHLGWFGLWGADRTAIDVQLRNIRWTVDAVAAAAELNCSRFIGISSVWELGAVEAFEVQGEKPGPSDVYGAVKLTCRVLGKLAAGEAGIDAVWALPVGVFGPGDNSPGVINYALQACVNNSPAKFSAGTQNFDVLYLTDVARAIRLAGERGKPFHDYVLGSGQAAPLRGFLTEMVTTLKPDLPVEFGAEPFKGVNIPLEAYSIASLTADTGFMPEVSFQDGCRITAEWINTQNPHG